MPDSGKLPFVLSCSDLDRLAYRRSDQAWLDQQVVSPSARFIPVCEDDNMALINKNLRPLLLDAKGIRPIVAQAQCVILLGNSRDQTYWALGLPARLISSGDRVTFTNLRPQFGALEQWTLGLLGYARAMVHWHRQNRYCGTCGTATQSRRSGHELHCRGCGNTLYPRVNPAIIVLVTHDEHCLLGRHASSQRFSTLAGFVEPGESLETAVRREVEEETNIRVTTLQYRASQPWPYPASLMLGFRGYAENTDIRCNDGELAEARWFSRADIVHGLKNSGLTLPTPQSIAYALLRDWFDEEGMSLDTLCAVSPVCQS